MTVEQSLTALRSDLLEKIRSLAPKEVAELERVERALKAIGGADQVEDSNLSHLDIAAAIKHVLMRAKAPMPRKRLISRLVKAGVAEPKGGGRSAEWKISQSIGYHKDSGLLTVKDDIVGLAEWESQESK